MAQLASKGKKTVIFSFHAAERLSQRFNTRISTRNDVDISQTFKPIGNARRHHTDGYMYQAYIPKDPSVRLVLLVNIEGNVVMTVMSEGPIVDACYRQACH